jgi:hypothetical protein
MIVERKQYAMPAGGSATIDGVGSMLQDVLRVQREGLGYNVIRTGVPGNREVKYIPMLRQLKFENAPLMDETVIVLLNVTI